MYFKRRTESSSESEKDSYDDIVKTKSNPFWKWFWLTFLVISLAYAWYSFNVPSNQVVWLDNIEEAKELAEETEKSLMLFFTGAWCVPCRIMKREIFTDKKVKQIMNSHVIPVLIDIDDPASKDLLEMYNIGTTPITIFTNTQGDVLDYAVGKISKMKFLEMIDNVNDLSS